MDSFTGALGYLFIYTPLRFLSKVIEAVGIVYGILKFPFEIGVYKSSKIYDKFK
jgi:hypothetical protein